MSFFGYEFIFDSKPSSEYGLVISSIGDSGTIESPQGSGISLITKKILRNPTEYLYGVEQQPVLEFDLEFFSQNPISGEMRNIVSSWLFGQQNFKILRILQSDLQNIYFNVFFINAVATYVGRVQYGWKAHARCDSPFANTNSQTILHSFSGSAIVNEVLTINNLSANAYYTYPTLAFRTSTMGNSFSITNINDNNRIFSFTALLAEETISVDCLRQIVVSNSGLLRVSHFNLKWFRLVPGINILTVVGGVTYYTMTIPIVKKVGA
jgi:phage-related protein